MLEVLKKYFIPHEGNNYKPHALHTKRAFFYSGVFLVIKGLVITFAILLPTEAFLVPDVLEAQAKKIVDLTNAVRVQKGLPELAYVAPLNTSADAKANDMVSQSYFSHTGPHNHTLAYFLNQANYKYRVAGENLAMGFSDADSVVNAWIKSPSHYSNLIDTDFSQIGIGVEAGYYDGQPTVYVAQHFGDPMPGAVVRSSAALSKTASSTGALSTSTAPQVVRGEKISAAAELYIDPQVQNFVFDREKSKVYWFEVNGTTRLEVRAFIAGAVDSVVVSVQNYPIELYKTATGTYIGSIVITGPVDGFFNPIITPSITITSNGNKVNDTIDWSSVKVVGENPIQKYLRAKKLLSPVVSLFSVSTTIYWGFLILCVTAFIINIAVEVRKQHYHIIAQTLFIMILLVWLLRF